MKTTVEIPDAIYRQVKALAATEGRSVKELLNEAIREILAKKSMSGETGRGWRAVFGKAPRSATHEVQGIIDREFSAIDLEQWK